MNNFYLVILDEAGDVDEIIHPVNQILEYIKNHENNTRRTPERDKKDSKRE